MSGVGSTNAMKKGSANNPFLAYSEADMQGFLNSAYTGCIVKYTGPSTKKLLEDHASGDAQNLISDVSKTLIKGAGGGNVTCDITIQDSQTYYRIYDLYIDRGGHVYDPERVTNPEALPDFIYAVLLVKNYYRKYQYEGNFNIKDMDVTFLAVEESVSENPSLLNLTEKWPLTKGINGWQTNCFNTEGRITLWGHDDTVKYTNNLYSSSFMYDEPYVVNELYEVVYGNGRYYFEEFYHISENVTTATVEDVAPGKTFYDFTGTKQTGTGTKINPYIATDLNTFKSFPVGSFIKWLGPDRTVIDETTGQTLIQNEIYRAVEDGDVFQYVILPTLSNPGTAADLAQGKQLIDGDGKVVEGELEKVTNYLPLFMSDGLEEIPFDALKGCTKLHDYAFYNNTNIKTINVPETVKTFGNRLTEGSTALTKVNIKSLHAWLESTFGEYGNLVQAAKHLYVNDVPLTHITKNDSDGIINISAYAFRGCTDLVAVELSDSVESIGESIFSICTNLKTFKAKSLKIIPERCFEDVSLSSIDVPNVTVIKGPYSMGSSDSFLDMELEFPLVTSVGISAFYYCAAKSLSFPSLVNAIGDFNFYNNSHLKSINLPLMENMPQVYFLENCTSITKIILPKLITFKLQGISRCNALKTIDLPSVTTITNYSSYCFNYMHNVRLLLRYNGVVTLSTTQLPNAITEIYVPNDQVDNYKADSKWSTYADKIKSLDDFVE